MRARGTPAMSEEAASVAGLRSEVRPPAPGPPEPSRVAMISLHTSPRDQPGVGDSGGMNVYVLSVARRLAEQGVLVDVFTRCRGTGAPEVEEVAPGSRIIQVQAGPCAPLPKEELPRVLPLFLGGVLDRAAREGRGNGRPPYDVVHSHYWLSGWVGSRAREAWGVPHVASFHTLARVKDAVRPPGEPPEPPVRLAGELRVVRGADRILAPTATEASHLVGLYGADPARVRVVPPGVDGRLFAPRPKGEARRELGFRGSRLLLFVGRLQPLKGPDVAVRTLGEVLARRPDLREGTELWVVGGPSSPRGDEEVERLRSLALSLGVERAVRFHPPQPHDRLASFYSAADVVLVPSRSESFGLVALEAQACGTPVVGAAVGGLRHVVEDGATGFLVEGHDPAAHAARVLAILDRPGLASRLSARAAREAVRFSWDATVRGLRTVYREVVAPVLEGPADRGVLSVELQGPLTSGDLGRPGVLSP
jgi:D-inositol-3-phosphate glycosyltransferase